MVTLMRRHADRRAIIKDVLKSAQQRLQRVELPKTKMMNENSGSAMSEWFYNGWNLTVYKYLIA